MKAGKLSEPALKRSVLKQIHNRRPEVTACSAVGADYAAIRPREGEELVFAVHPVTRAGEHLAHYGIAEVLNNVACSGAAPIAVLASVLLSTEEKEPQLRGLMADLEKACADEGVALIGGHTEVSRRVKEPLLTLTGIGSVQSGERIPSDGARPGMELVMTGYCGAQGTAILVQSERERLRTRFGGAFLDEAERIGMQMSAVRQARAAAQAGAAAIHDISEGGVFAALWEMAQAAGTGLAIDLKKLPIRQETIEICEFFALNPYKLITGGGLLIAAQNGEEIVRAIAQTGHAAAVIGCVTDGKDRIVLNDGERRFLETPQTDELYRVIR